jgi:hypothetical protein
VNWAAVAEQGGYKDAKIARIRFCQIRRKVLERAPNDLRIVTPTKPRGKAKAKQSQKKTGSKDIDSGSLPPSNQNDIGKEMFKVEPGTKQEHELVDTEPELDLGEDQKLWG